MVMAAKAVGVAVLSGGGASAADAQHPVVVELFQSQGCSSCPPAIANLNELATREDVLALDFAVTYWDYLGWKDTFAKPAFTERQRDYAAAGARDGVWTPQMIVNGRGAIVGNRKGEIDGAIAKFDRAGAGPAVSYANDRVTIGAGQGDMPADVWLVRYDPRVQRVSIKAGENGGRTLPHVNIVRDLRLLGKWNGDEASFAAPKDAGADAYAILVQKGRGGPIIAAKKI